MEAMIATNKFPLEAGLSHRHEKNDPLSRDPLARRCLSSEDVSVFEKVMQSMLGPCCRAEAIFNQSSTSGCQLDGDTMDDADKNKR